MNFKILDIIEFLYNSEKHWNTIYLVSFLISDSECPLENYLKPPQYGRKEICNEILEDRQFLESF